VVIQRHTHTKKLHSWNLCLWESSGASVCVWTWIQFSRARKATKKLQKLYSNVYGNCGKCRRGSVKTTYFANSTFSLFKISPNDNGHPYTESHEMGVFVCVGIYILFCFFFLLPTFEMFKFPTIFRFLIEHLLLFTIILLLRYRHICIWLWGTTIPHYMYFLLKSEIIRVCTIYKYYNTDYNLKRKNISKEFDPFWQILWNNGHLKHWL